MVGTIMGSPRYISNISKDEFEMMSAGFILSALENALQTKGDASLFLSGGSTPGPIYQRLSETVFPWEKVNIGLVDDRWVNETDKGSNAALIRGTLLQSAAKSAKFTPLKTLHKTAIQGQAEAEQNYHSLLNSPSIALLGMGTDGHVCSWFPEAKGLAEAIDSKSMNKVQAIQAISSNVTGAYLERISLTLSALQTFKEILLLISGEQKKSILEGAIAFKSTHLPVSHLLAMANAQANNPLTIFHAE